MKGQKVTALPTAEGLNLMMNDILHTIDKRKQRKTRLHRIAALGTIGVLALGTTAGAMVVTQASQAQRNMVECYESADLNSRQISSIHLPAEGTPESVITGDDRIMLAVDMCGATWRIGAFEADPGAARPGQTFPIPDLVACQLLDGRIGVFPSEKSPEEQCRSLGLAVP